MSSSSIVSAIMSKPLGALLKPHGFKKTGMVFRRVVGGSPQVIACQSRAGKTAKDAAFVLNLGIFIPAVEKVLGQKPVAQPKEFECTIRTRIGPPGKGDRWWSISSEAPPAFDRRMGDVIDWFEGASDHPTLQRMLETGSAWAQDALVPVALALVRGESALAQRLLDACVVRVHEERAKRASQFPKDPFGLGLLKDAKKLATKHSLSIAQ